MHLCVRCGSSETSESLGLCKDCVVSTRAEVSTGLRRLADYLAAWAAFDEWCRLRGSTP